MQDLAAAIRGQAGPPEPPLPSTNEWKSGLARVPEERLRKILVAQQHPEASEAKNEPYITLPGFAKAVGAVVLQPEEDGKRRKVANAGGAKGGAKGGASMTTT